MEQWFSFLRSNFRHLDSSDQELIYLSFRNFIYQEIYFLSGNHELAEDVVQESFIKVISKAHQLHSDVNMKAWMKTVARNTAYDLIKKSRKYQHVSEPYIIMDTEISCSIYTVAQQVEDQIRHEMLYAALNELSPTYRQALFLYYIEEKSYKEIAAQLNSTEQALAQTMVRARKKLHHHFSKRWMDCI